MAKASVVFLSSSRRMAVLKVAASHLLVELDHDAVTIDDVLCGEWTTMGRQAVNNVSTGQRIELYVTAWGLTFELAKAVAAGAARL